jgi:multiple sugar transport system permease protein
MNTSVTGDPTADVRTARPPGAGRQRSEPRFRRFERYEGLLYIAPLILGIVAFQLFPILVSIYISLTEWDGIAPPRFVGLDNFRTMFTGDPLFLETLSNTVVFTILAIPLTTVLGFFLALLCNRQMRGISLLRAAYFAPYITNVVAIGYIWYWIYNPERGLINALLSNVGIDGPSWLASSTWAMPAVVIVSVWQGAGYPMVIFLAGMQGIPQDLYEAAEIDGAGPWRRVRRITMPLLTPHLFFVLVTQFITSFQVFGIIYIMTQGGPGHSTSVYIYYLYQQAFGSGKLGYASALAWLLFVILVTVTYVQWRLQRRWVFYG